MRKNKLFALGMAGCMMAGTVFGMTNVSTASASTFTNSYFDYDSALDGNYKSTEARDKNYSGSDLPHGYVYAISADGLDSSILVRKMTKAGNGADCSNGYVTAVHMRHTRIRNNYSVSNDKWVRLRVRTNQNSGVTRGYWSPDSASGGGYIVG